VSEKEGERRARNIVREKTKKEGKKQESNENVL